MRSKSARNCGPSSGSPLTLEKIWTPVAPSVSIARSISVKEASGLFIGSEATKPGKRSGCFATSSAIPSFARRASSGVASGPASASIGGDASVRTWA